MRLPVLQGIIRRRLLVNFRVDPEVLQRQLPAPFRPKLHAGQAIGGICLIRLEAIRPRLLPPVVGLSSENAAHRIAVVWETAAGESKEGVYIPRRDTGSLVNLMTGGRVFPGEHHRARFHIEESATAIDFRMRSDDGEVEVRVRGRFDGELPPTSCFGSLEQASRFFEPGSLGYSATRAAGRLDGLELRTHGWQVEPLEVDEVHSSYFADPDRFPSGSAVFDCALLMRNLAHEWHAADDLYVEPAAARA